MGAASFSPYRADLGYTNTTLTFGINNVFDTRPPLFGRLVSELRPIKRELHPTLFLDVDR
jgi:hypothetical protein